jgi:hypothetical protein
MASLLHIPLHYDYNYCYACYVCAHRPQIYTDPMLASNLHVDATLMHQTPSANAHASSFSTKHEQLF